MTKISVTRALSQLKVLDKRIQKAIQECQPSGVIIGRKIPAGFATEDELKKRLQANLDAPRDLIKHRIAIKQAIVMSNAATKVTINGVEMTVAEAIETKASIGQKKDLLDVLRQYQNRANSEYNRAYDAATEKADKMAEVALGSDSDKKGEDYKSFVEKYMETNGPKFIKADGLDKVIESLADEITKFEHEVDYVLSESNATTFLEVDSGAL